MNVDDLPVDARLHRNRGVGLDIADRLEVHRDRLLHRGGDGDKGRARSFGRRLFLGAGAGAEVGRDAARRKDEGDSGNDRVTRLESHPVPNSYKIRSVAKSCSTFSLSRTIDAVAPDTITSAGRGRVL